MIEVKIDDAGVVREALEQLRRAGVNARSTLAEVGEHLIDSTRRRFQAGVAPDGQRWASNSEVTIQRLLARYRGMACSPFAFVFLPRPWLAKQTWSAGGRGNEFDAIAIPLRFTGALGFDPARRSATRPPRS